MLQEISVRVMLTLAFALASAGTDAQSESDTVTAVRTQVRVSQLFGWQPLDAEHLLLWTGKEEVWQLGLAPACASLMTTRNIAVTADSRHIKTGRDQVRTGKEACTIREFSLPDAALLKRYHAPRKRYQADLEASELPTGKPATNNDANEAGSK